MDRPAVAMGKITTLTLPHWGRFSWSSLASSLVRSEPSQDPNPHVIQLGEHVQRDAHPVGNKVDSAVTRRLP